MNTDFDNGSNSSLPEPPSVIGDYFRSYGGWSALLTSWYLWISIGLTVFLFPFWSKGGWWDLVLTVIPGLLGFSVAGIAVFLALGGEGFRSVLAGQLPDDKVEISPFLSFVAMFCHFFVIQVLALIFAVVSKAAFTIPTPNICWLSSLNDYFLRPVVWFLAFLFFIYAIMECFAIALEIFRLGRMVDDYESDRKNESATNNKP